MRGAQREQLRISKLLYHYGEAENGGYSVRALEDSKVIISLR